VIEGDTPEETIRLTAEAYGISLDQAGFIYAIETGEIDSDVTAVDDDGNVMKMPEPPHV
jgi:hypothetical protein